jgi:hypothetical protein
VPQAPDTSEVVDRMMTAAYRDMAPWQKVRRIEELCRSASLLALAGIRSRQPELTEGEALVRLAEIRLGTEVTRRVLDARSAVSRR